MPVTARLTLAPEPASVPRARELVREVFARSTVDVDEDTVLLLVSEVVTNAVLHARTPISLDVTSGDGVVRVEVGDASPVAPQVRHYSIWSATGRGLRLLDRLASRWGIEHSDAAAAKVVWFEVGDPGSNDARVTATGGAR